MNVDLRNLEDYCGSQAYRVSSLKMGVSIFCLNDSNIARLDNLSPSNENIEVCSVPICSNSLSLFIIGIYRTPHSSDENVIEALEERIVSKISY